MAGVLANEGKSTAISDQSQQRKAGSINVVLGTKAVALASRVGLPPTWRTQKNEVAEFEGRRGQQSLFLPPS